MGYIYILTNWKRTVLYIGVTSDLEKRLTEHKEDKGSSFTIQYQVKYLVYREEHMNITDAIKREKQLKKWLREWKEELISEQNPEWIDLLTGEKIGE